MTRCAAALIAMLCWPAAAAADISYRFPGADAHRQYFYVTAYRDLTGLGGGLQDWGCGTKTYDGHRGTDLGVGGFPGMDAGRDVVAAAAGTVVQLNDGAFDRCTTGDCAGGSGFGNYVLLEHADGKKTYYGHLKKFSVAVAVGDTVTCGQKLGQVGSSGNSTGPHLHFEPRVNNVSDDPFSGPCGGPISWWVAQGAYLGLPETACHDAPPPHPLLSLGLEIEPIAGQEPDARPEGESTGIFDLEAGQTVSTRFSITNDAGANPAREVVVGLEAPGGFLTVLD
ncbi:MAG TPA: M23 family metallopeptidase, partial [Kofleriaceae bacterium]|nr:M23 family metallopeptidase [Kofleriaceae bacterium]